MISVLLVDDQDLVRIGLRTLFEATDGFTVAGEAADGLAAVEGRRDRARRRPHGHPDAGHRRSRGHPPHRREPGPGPTRVIVLTTFERDEYVFDALRIGASGFLLKNTPPASCSPPCAPSRRRSAARPDGHPHPDPRVRPDRPARRHAASRLGELTPGA